MSTRTLLIIPCYNEATRLQAQPFLQLVAANRSVRLLFVDDGSTDGTPAILANIQSGGRDRISVLTLPANAGKASAVQRGVLAAIEEQPEFVGYWDADLSTPLSELQAFIGLLDSCPEVDIAMGARVRMLGRRIKRSPLRHYAGRMFATAASIALRIAVYDTQCGAKVFRVNDAVRQAFGAPFRSPWVMDVEILARYIATVGRASAVARICEIPLQAWTDVPGSKLGVGHALGALWSLFVIWRDSRTRPGIVKLR